MVSWEFMKNHMAEELEQIQSQQTKKIHWFEYLK